MPKVSGVTIAPFTSVPSVQVTVIGEPLGVQARLPGTNVAPAGKTSVTITFVASPGPLFVTVSVYVIVPPAITVGGAPVIFSVRSRQTVTQSFATKASTPPFCDVSGPLFVVKRVVEPTGGAPDSPATER